MTQLARRGPYKVLSGDLGIVGITGSLFVPAEGERLPAIAFGHAWMTTSARYRDLLMHLASWGIVVVAPDSQTGMLASDTALAADLRSTLTVVSRFPLGFGQITVDPEKIGVAGHGFGASAAVIAAGTDDLGGQPPLNIRGVAGVFPAPTTATLLPTAATVTAPGTFLANAGDLDKFDANALPLSQAYGGDVTLRTIAKGGTRDLLERRSIKNLLGINGADKKVHAATRALITGFVLATVADDPTYAVFTNPEELLGKLGNIDLDDAPERELDHVSMLVGAKPRRRRARTD